MVEGSAPRDDWVKARLRCFLYLHGGVTQRFDASFEVRPLAFYDPRSSLQRTEETRFLRYLLFFLDETLVAAEAGKFELGF